CAQSALNDGAAGGRIAHVDLERARLAAAGADSLGNARRIARVDVGDGELRAVGRQTLCAGLANAGAAANDQRDASREIEECAVIERLFRIHEAPMQWSIDYLEVLSPIRTRGITFAAATGSG